MTGVGASSLSSPRLPSPPPFTEVQIGPKSPTVNDGLPEPSPAQDDASTRRIRPGTRAVDMASGPPLIPLAQLDSPFQLQEHLKALHFYFTQPHTESTVTPITRETAKLLAEPPEGIERTLWLYELCRFLTMRVNSIVIAFFSENPPCSAQTCPEMRASEWQYLCAVHSPPKACCAIDYCCHTLDWATNILTSPKFFPSRLTLGSESGGGAQTSLRHLTNIFRRVYRIFAHAWFQHRDVFWQVEGLDGLYVFFKTVCDVYNLIPEDNWTIPPEAEGEEAHTIEPEDGGQKMTILRKEDRLHPEPKPDHGPNSLGMGATTRRHRHSPSTGAAVGTITEAAEDEDASRNAGNVTVLGKMQDKGTRRQIEEDISETTPEEASENTTGSTDEEIPALSEKTEEEQRVKMANSAHSTPFPDAVPDTIPGDQEEREVDEEETAAIQENEEKQGQENEKQLKDDDHEPKHEPVQIPESEDEFEHIQKSEEPPEEEHERIRESEVPPEDEHEQIRESEEPPEDEFEHIRESEKPPKEEHELIEESEKLPEDEPGHERDAEPDSKHAPKQEQKQEQKEIKKEDQKQEQGGEISPSEEVVVKTKLEDPSDDPPAKPEPVNQPAPDAAHEETDVNIPKGEEGLHIEAEAEPLPAGEANPPPEAQQEEEKIGKT